jgi:hypothetical protein
MPRTGYETTPPTGGGGIGLSFTIEKSNFIAGAKETGKALTRLERNFNSALRMKGYSITQEATSSDRYNAIDIYVSALSSALEDSAQDWGKKVAAGGKAMFREVIKSAPNRVKPRPGRIETHLMLNSVKGTTKKYKNESVVAIGWTGTYYRYFSFQEDGTRTGPMPMHAIPKTAKYITNEFNNTFGRMLKYRIENIK